MKNNLHILTSNNIPSVVLGSAANHGVLLLREAVYLLLKPTKLKHAKIYVLEEDLLARGLNNLVDLQNITLINYHDFVALSLEYQSNITWT